MKRMLTALTVVLATTAPVAAMAQCFPEALQTSLKTMSLKRELMVASLSCSGDWASDYNAFVAGHGTKLDAHSRTLQAHFRKTYGGASENRFMKFDSQLANEISFRVMTNPTYCTEAVALFQEIRQTPTDRLESLAQTRPSLDVADGNICKPKPTTVAKTPAPATPAKPVAAAKP